MGAYKNKTYPLRIDNSLRLKVEFIANLEDRRISQQYERIIKAYISQYEAIYGEIKVDSNNN